MNSATNLSLSATQEDLVARDDLEARFFKTKTFTVRPPPPPKREEVDELVAREPFFKTKTFTIRPPPPPKRTEYDLRSLEELD